MSAERRDHSCSCYLCKPHKYERNAGGKGRADRKRAARDEQAAYG